MYECEDAEQDQCPLRPSCENPLASPTNPDAMKVVDYIGDVR